MLIIFLRWCPNFFYNCSGEITIVIFTRYNCIEINKNFFFLSSPSADSGLMIGESGSVNMINIIKVNIYICVLISEQLKEKTYLNHAIDSTPYCDHDLLIV